MKGISQLVVSILLVGVAVASGILLAYTVTDLVETYQPSQVMISRVGDINVGLDDVRWNRYRFMVSTKLVNLGSKPFTIPRDGGWIVVLVKGTTGRVKILSCPFPEHRTLMPGDIEIVSAYCSLSSSDLRELFGYDKPPGDRVKQAFRYVYLYFLDRRGGGGSGGGGRVPGYIVVT